MTSRVWKYCIERAHLSDAQLFLRGSLLSESLSMCPRLVAHAAFLAHLMYAPPSPQKALAQEAQTRDRLRAKKKTQLRTIETGRVRVLV